MQRFLEAALCVLAVTVPTYAVAAIDEPAAAASNADDPAKFFLFHTSEMPKDVVRADLFYCIDRAQNIIAARDRFGSGGGLIGALINSRMASIDRFRMRNASMRKCMGLMGYDRYAMPQAEWKVLVKDGDIVVDNKNRIDPEVVERMVDFATGPAPKTEKLPR